MTSQVGLQYGFFRQAASAAATAAIAGGRDFLCMKVEAAILFPPTAAT